MSMAEPLSSEEQLSVDQALAKLTELSKCSFADFLTIADDGTPELDFDQARETGALQAVKKFTLDRYGKITIELYSVLDIIQMILRVYGKITATAAGIENAGNAGEAGVFFAEDLASVVKQFERDVLEIEFGDDESELDEDEDGDGD